MPYIGPICNAPVQEELGGKRLVWEAQFKPGVNISFYSPIYHWGKVSHFWRYREEFSQIWILALHCCKLKTVSEGDIRGRFPYWTNASLQGKVFSNREFFPAAKHFPTREEKVCQWDMSLSGKFFPARETLPFKVNPSLSGKPFTVRETVPYFLERGRLSWQGNCFPFRERSSLQFSKQTH